MCYSLNAQITNSDTLKVVVKTKFGELTFMKFCKKDKLDFVQSSKPIFDEKVEKDAEEKNITEDKLKMKFTINSSGKLESCELVKASKLKSLDSFLMEIFNEAIFKLSTEDYTLSCNGKRKSYLVPIVYKTQEKKK